MEVMAGRMIGVKTADGRDEEMGLEGDTLQTERQTGRITKAEHFLIFVFLLRFLFFSKKHRIQT